ncbi:right-handed parallel beta-helix repeat-containing protein [Candidatus Uabimicrobium sp. HlEnr_7]|uniref:right-handed parallel beta-helix repeat-containing protein n=1 Tax=Candidatus Uabimicrobium helgolandensis TaxID=3095367 RepID=UPI003557C4B7
MKNFIKTILTFLLITSFSVSAQDIYISKTGKNSNPGTKEKPKKTLWKAISALKDGDTIHVAEGLYYGRGKSGVMPVCDKSNVALIGGWSKDFSERNPFKYLTIIGPPANRQGSSKEVFKWEKWNGKIDNVTIDGFCVDRGCHSYYYSTGEPGANKSIEGHHDNSCWGYRAINKKKSGSDPTIELIGKGSFTVRNMILLNNPWWGIYVKCGGNGKVTIENNLILISRGRAVEAITGGGWGKPNIIIRNNTIAFNHQLKSTEGRALSVDPRSGAYTIENNILAFSDGGGITLKFDSSNMTLNNNKFYFNRRGDYCIGGKGMATADEFEDELECDNEENVNELPKFLKGVGVAWFDRYSSRESRMTAGDYNTEEALMAARNMLGLKEYHIPGYSKTFPTYSKLPQQRNNYDMSRYPHPMKKGENLDWKKFVLPIIGLDDFGIQDFQE